MICLENEYRIRDYWSQQQLAETPSSLDVTILELEEGGFRWITPSTPPISGAVPLRRIQFVVNYMSKLDRVILWGGLTLTLSNRTVRTDDYVYVLNLKTMHWSRPAVDDTKEMLDPQINVSNTGTYHKEVMITK